MNERKKRLLDAIKYKCIRTSVPNELAPVNGQGWNWLFDIKSNLLEASFLDDLVETFWQTYKDEYPFQVGGMETAAIPIVGAIVASSAKRGTPVSGFYIRKSRNKNGLQKRIEGILNNEKIILIDDLINRGKSLNTQLDVLKEEGRSVSHLFTLVRFRDESYYDYLSKIGIKLSALFSLVDFEMKLLEDDIIFPRKFYDILWYFKSSNPSFKHVYPKSTPVLDEKKVYFGSDSGIFWALNQINGAIAWKFQTYGFSRKGIFSSPVLNDGKVYFGAYNGSMYCLDSQTGKKLWMFSEADWIGSSPALAENLGLIFIGLEFGLFNRQGGIVALDLKTGKKKWEYMMDKMTHSSPFYIAEKNLVLIGNNNGVAYAFDASSGKLKWECKTKGDIKDSFVFNEKRNMVFFGSLDGYIYGVDIENGEIKFSFAGEFGIYSSPCLFRDHIIFSCLDKNVYCVNLNDAKLRWKFETTGRIFSKPSIIGNNVYVGSNDGIMYEIDFEKGKMKSTMQLTERITNKIVYNEETKRFFVLTQANELYCLSRKAIASSFETISVDKNLE